MKQRIMDSTVRFFSEKGYVATSIQDIADDCGIAKGSLYKFFPSKEDLFIEVHLAKQNQLLADIAEIRANPDLSLQEIFIRETESQLNFFVQNKFIMKDILEVNATEGKITEFLLQLRANLLTMSKEGVIRRFGEAVEPHVWDLIVMYAGIMHEYLFLLVFENAPLNIREISEYMVDRYEEMAENVIRKNPKPILRTDMMAMYMDASCMNLFQPKHEQIETLLAQLSSSVKELPCANHRRTELQEAIQILQSELALESPKMVLLRAILHFLENEPELKGTAVQLEKLVCRS
ncbi:TetR/AcrR family transcriptional regulator [Paenibacillus pectinilyticus]|uniref:TetR/AcrR family transcriptional regulator n=1 Tax=Paenibacillus pectinilyticus TaxID=512399 RepID=UPI001FC92C36|nr:TetR/AcrR family transcriptional regulator [Paenibacillus pectinilyticus]